jgi:hypothetical protein
MRRMNCDPPRWHFVQVPPDVVARFRRWNVVMIAILAFIVLGLIVAASVPNPWNNTTTTSTVPLKNRKQHTP